MGTVTLNVVTYLDMVVRGRPASTVPANLAGKLLGAAGFELGGGYPKPEPAQQTRQNRLTGMGALLGYGTGLTIGAAYGLLHSRSGGVPMPIAGAAVGLAAMAASDLPAVTTGVTNPAKWGIAGWAADIVPHLAYGMATVLAFQALRD